MASISAYRTTRLTIGRGFFTCQMRLSAFSTVSIIAIAVTSTKSEPAQVRPFALSANCVRYLNTVREMSAGSRLFSSSSSSAFSKRWNTGKRVKSAKLTARNGTTDSRVVNVRLPAACGTRSSLARRMTSRARPIMGGLRACVCPASQPIICFSSVTLSIMRNIMPAKAPRLDDPVSAQLEALGKRIRAQRKRFAVAATTAAEAAGMSRVTLHRVERGEPSVTMGAYMSALAALGLALDVTDVHRARSRSAPAVSALPGRICVRDYPQLERLAWQRKGDDSVTPAEALSLYERNWRRVDQARIEPKERALLEALSASLGGGRLLV